MLRTIVIASTMLVLAHLATVHPSAAQDPPNWTETKCILYKKSWTDALSRHGQRGLSKDFIDSHEAFLATGCTGPADVCPRTLEDFALANTLTILAMNFGTASTFLPFGCRK